MLDKLAAVSSRYEELCAKSEQPDFYDDPKRAAALQCFFNDSISQKAKQNFKENT